MPRLTRSSIQRIGAAVRSYEGGAAGKPLPPPDPFLTVLRLAKVTDVVDDTPDAGDPYIYEASIYAGHWTDAPAERTALATTINVWSPVALSVDDWISVIRIGAHWEMFGGGGAAIPTPDAEGTFMLVATDGVLAWVEVEPFGCSE